VHGDDFNDTKLIKRIIADNVKLTVKKRRCSIIFLQCFHGAKEGKHCKL
jgi:hypothetical protein